jgi:hypothetical protein
MQLWRRARLILYGCDDVLGWLRMVVTTCSVDFIWLWWRARLERRQWWGERAWFVDPGLWVRRGRAEPAGGVRIARADVVKTARRSERVRLGFGPGSTPTFSHLPSSLLGLEEGHYICWDWLILDLFTCIFQANWLNIRMWDSRFSRQQIIYGRLEYKFLSEVYICLYTL